MNIEFLPFKMSGFPSVLNFLKRRGSFRRSVLIGLGLLLGANVTWGRVFTLLVYNVENLFDADGIANYRQYAVEGEPSDFSYTPRKLLTKIRNVHQILALVNEGKGPEIILFQEIELDRTPQSRVEDYGSFLRKYTGTTVDAMLTSGFDDSIAGIPAEAFLLKYLEDNGLSGYEVVKPVSAKPLEERTAQNNVVFSRFPIEYTKFHPLERARDILEVGLLVDGHPIIVFDNHWKSGASNPETEPLRIQNAGVLRKRLDELLWENPSTDIILGGDFNSYYNQKIRNPEMEQTALNDVLRSREDEKALIENDDVDLYNLWLELPAGKRGSEVYRGRWGTLMQIMLTPGLYDFNGVQYVDDSFFVLSVPGLNAGETFGRPKRWHFFGAEGGGFSDHFPVGARFRTLEDNDADQPLLVDYKGLSSSAVHSVDELEGLPDAGLGERFGTVYKVEAELIVKERETAVKVGGRYFTVGSFRKDIRDALKNRGNGAAVHFWGELGEYRETLNFLIQDENWLKN